MKTELYTNCSLVRVPIKTGVTDYYFPQNVDWAGKRVDKIVVCAPQNACTDPVDGVTPVLTLPNLDNLYFSITTEESNIETMHDVSYEQLLHRNNNPLRVDGVVNLALSRLYFTQAPASDATLLLYVFWQTRTEEDYDLPKRSMSVNVPLNANQELSFRDIINFAIHALPDTVKGVIMWDAETSPVYVTLRDHQLTYMMTDIHSEMMRADMLAQDAFDTQAALFMLNDLDIDFDYSRIREAAGQNTMQRITFLY